MSFIKEIQDLTKEMERLKTENECLREAIAAVDKDGVNPGFWGRTTARLSAKNKKLLETISKLEEFVYNHEYSSSNGKYTISVFEYGDAISTLKLLESDDANMGS